MQLKKWSVLGAAALMSISMTGCLGDDDKNETSTTATIEIAEVLSAGSKMDVKGSVESGNTIDTLEVMVEYVTNPSYADPGVQVSDKPEAGAKSISLDEMSLTAAEDACDGDYKVILYYTSSNGGGTKEATFKVEGGKSDCTEAEGTALSAAKTGVIYNVKGKEKGAYDLLLGELVGASAADDTKDLKDMSVAATDDDLFSKKFTSGNGAKFAVVELDFAAATKEELEAVTGYEAETAVLKDGDVVAVKLSADRGGDLLLIKVVKVTDDQVGDNTGKIDFEYKTVVAE